MRADAARVLYMKQFGGEARKLAVRTAEFEATDCPCGIMP